MIQRIVRSELWQNLDGKIPDLEQVIDDVTRSLGNIRRFAPALQVIVKTSYEVAIGWSLVFCLSFAVVGVLSSLLIREKTLTGRS